MRSIRELPEPLHELEPTPLDRIVEPTPGATVRLDAGATGDGGVAARTQ